MARPGSKRAHRQNVALSIAAALAILGGALPLASCSSSDRPRQRLTRFPPAILASIKAARRPDPAAALEHLRAHLAREPMSLVGRWLSLYSNLPESARGPLREELARIGADPSCPPGVRMLARSVTLDPVTREAELHEMAKLADGSAGVAWAILGEIARERGHETLAATRFESAVAQDPEFAPGWLALAQSRIRSGSLLEAAQPLENYLDAAPEDPLALYNLGWIYLEARRQPKEAYPWLVRAVAADPADVSALVALGACAMSLDPPEITEAKTALLAALEVAPDDPEVHMNLGVLYADHERHPAAAIGHFKRYLELGGPAQERVAAWIRELEGTS